MTVVAERAVRTSGPGWELVTRPPAPLLDPLAGAYQGYVEDTSATALRRHAPGPQIAVIFTLGGPMTHFPRGGAGEGEALDTFVAGMHESPAVTASPASSWGVQVNFTPAGAYQLLGLPLDELANRSVALSDILGSDATELTERMREAPDWESRFDLLDRSLTRRMLAAEPASEGVAWAWNKLASTAGSTPTGEIARELGWSRKRLIAEFRRYAGLPPKTVARIMRFSRAERMLRARPDARSSGGLARIALECGYYDQAHFNREFRGFAGATPTQYIGLSLPDGGVGADAAGA